MCHFFLWYISSIYFLKIFFVHLYAEIRLKNQTLWVFFWGLNFVVGNCFFYLVYMNFIPMLCLPVLQPLVTFLLQSYDLKACTNFFLNLIDYCSIKEFVLLILQLNIGLKFLCKMCEDLLHLTTHRLAKRIVLFSTSFLIKNLMLKLIWV